VNSSFAYLLASRLTFTCFAIVFDYLDLTPSAPPLPALPSPTVQTFYRLQTLPFITTLRFIGSICHAFSSVVRRQFALYGVRYTTGVSFRLNAVDMPRLANVACHLYRRFYLRVMPHHASRSGGVLPFALTLGVLPFPAARSFRCVYRVLSVCALCVAASSSG